MFFRIDKKVINVNDGIYTGVVVAHGLDNATVSDKINELLGSEIKKAETEFSGQNIKNIPTFDLYRNAMSSLGINSGKYPLSIESIITRIVKKGEFPLICPVVDLGNYISIKYRIPVGVHDIGTLKEDFVLRLANLDDCHNTENSLDNDKLIEGEPVYISGNTVITRRWLWRQMPATRVTEKSQDFLFIVDGFLGNKDIIDSACDELAAMIKEVFDIETESGRITPEEMEYRFGEMTEEERMVENQISIMLKGVAQHTSVSQIRERIIKAKNENRPLRIKLGLDPSAPDIHIGHSVVLRKIKQLQDLGHLAVIIIGDYTGMIGDPTGKSKTRKQLSKEDVRRNANTYMEQIFKIIDRDKTEVYFNSEWLSKMSFGDVIELAAKCTVAHMLERDDFNNRYTNHLPLSVHEFFYPLMQAYDSVAVKADIELGGTDQTFNILMGRDIQRDYGMEPQLTLFMPLLEGVDGVEKMSKSLNNYIGVSETPCVVYEKVMKIPDNMILKYYNLCTDIHPSEIAKIEERLNVGANPRDVKMSLAYEITKLYSSESDAKNAEERFKSVFQQNVIPDDAPVIEIKKGNGIEIEQIINELVSKKYYKSKSEIRRVLQQGGFMLNGEKVQSAKDVQLENGDYVVKIGKRNFFKIIVK